MRIVSQLSKHISKTIKPFVKISGEAKESQWRRFKWTLFREKDVGVLHNVLNSDSSGGDYGCALRKFLLDTENIIGGVDSGAMGAEVDASTTTYDTTIVNGG